MSHPPGSPDPDAPRDPAAGAPDDPWGTPPPDGQQPPEQPPYGEQPAYDQPPYGQPAYGQPAYGQPPYEQPAYGQPAYGQPPYGPYAGYPPPTNGKALAALWSGVGLLVTSCCMLGIFGFVPVVLGAKARNEIRASQGQQSGSGLALAGIICGILAMVVSLAVIAVVVVVVLSAGSSVDTYGSTST